MLIENTRELEITKVRYFRINFKYRGKLYTLNEHSDGYESILRLTEKCSDACLVSVWGGFNVSEYIKPQFGKSFKNLDNVAYKQIDLEHFAVMLNKLIEEN